MIASATEISLVFVLALVGLALLVLVGARVCHSSPPDWKALREEMVKHQIEAREVVNPRVLEAMRRVPRHRFVPESLREKAYQDRPLPIGHRQTISQPYIVAVMTELLDPQPGDRVLEIGTGSGYQAAVLSGLVEKVYSIEIIPELASAAAVLLRELGYGSVQTKAADGYYGWAEQAPFDAIIVTAASEFVPPPLIEQLKEAGLMVIPVGSPFFVQTLMLVQKQGNAMTSANLMPVRFVPFRRAE